MASYDTWLWVFQIKTRVDGSCSDLILLLELAVHIMIYSNVSVNNNILPYSNEIYFLNMPSKIANCPLQ